ncbi:MAG: hypothetical protein NC927_01045 [Candidatus Omnitrophica bacterium]|nr:hypothetical protein [Candidatus Omnitrophota bacterium]
MGGTIQKVIIMLEIKLSSTFLPVFKQYLQVVGGICDPRANSIYSYILLNAIKEEQKILLDGFSGGLWLRVEMKTDVMESGKVALPAKTLKELVSKLPNDQTITLKNINESQINIGYSLEGTENKSAVYTIYSITDEGFPLIQANLENSISIFGQDFAEALKSVIYATPKKSSNSLPNTVLDTVNVSISDDKIELAASDGKRLAYAQISTENNDNKTENEEKPENKETKLSVFNLPVKTAEFLQGVLAKVNPEKIQVKIESAQIYFFMEEKNNETKLTLISDLFAGKYPEYKKLLPKNFTKKIILPKDETKSSLERILLFTGTSKAINLLINEDLILKTYGEEERSGQEIVSLTTVQSTTDGPVKITINCEFLLQTVKAIKSPILEMGINQPNNPILISESFPTEKKSNKTEYIKVSHIIMPIYTL